MDDQGLERARFALSALLEGNERLKTPDDAAAFAIQTWDLLLGAPNARTVLADIPAHEMTGLRSWMVAAIADDAGLPIADVQAAIDFRVQGDDQHFG